MRSKTAGFSALLFNSLRTLASLGKYFLLTQYAVRATIMIKINRPRAITAAERGKTLGSIGFLSGGEGV